MPPPHKGEDVLGQDSWKDVYGKKTWRRLNPAHPHTLDPRLLFMARAAKSQTNFSPFFFLVMAFGIYLRTKKKGCWPPFPNPPPKATELKTHKWKWGQMKSKPPDISLSAWFPALGVWELSVTGWSIWVWGSLLSFCLVMKDSSDSKGERTRPDCHMYSPYV